MAPHSAPAPLPDLFRQRLDEQLNLKHPLVRLTARVLTLPAENVSLAE